MQDIGDKYQVTYRKEQEAQKEQWKKEQQLISLASNVIKTALARI